jgi:type II secretory pathway pseudopilin PulG
MSQLGYTLLEIVVVLFMFALVSGIIAPRMLNMHASMQTAYQRQQVIVQINNLAFQSFSKHLRFQFETYPFKPDNIHYELLTKHIQLDIPENWELQARKPIIYRNGACNGGIIELKYKQISYQVELLPPFCLASI